MTYGLPVISAQEWQIAFTQRAISRDINQKIVKAAAVPLLVKDKVPANIRWDATQHALVTSKWSEAQYLDTNLQDWIDIEALRYSNFGYKLPPGWIDVDMDSPDVEFKRCILAALDRGGIDTRLRFGRVSVQFPSHLFVPLAEADAANFENLLQFLPRGIVIKGAKHKAELRASYVRKNDSITVNQTVIPGSVYCDRSDFNKNDLSIWYNKSNRPAATMDEMLSTTPAPAQFRELVRAICYGAILYLVAPGWTEGDRQTNSLALFGLLARELVKHEALGQHDTVYSHVMSPFETDQDVLDLIDFICAQCGDEDAHRRKQAFKDALAKLRHNPGDARIPGWPKVVICFSAEVAAALRIALKTGSNISVIESFEEQYIFDKSSGLYIDLHARRDGCQRFTFSAGELSERHKGDRIDIAGRKPVLAFPLFQHSSGRIKIDTQDFLPACEPNAIVRIATTGEIVENGYDGNSRLSFNTYPGFVIKPTTKFDAQLMQECDDYLDTLLDLLTRENKNQSAWIKKWLAYILQHPDDKLPVALVMIGGQGTGKSFFGNTFLGALWGDVLHNIMGSDALTGKYWIEPIINRLLVFVDEPNFTDRGAIELVKLLIRSPKLTGQFKYGHTITTNNCAQFVFATNKTKFGITKEDTADRTLFIIRPFDEQSKHLGARDYISWIEGLKPFFLAFGRLLKRVDAREHFTHKFMAMDVTLEEVQSLGFSSGFDEDLARGNLSWAAQVILNIIESSYIMTGHHMDCTFTKDAFNMRAGDLIKSMGYTKVSAAQVFGLMRDKGLIEPLTGGKWRTTQKLGTLAETYSAITGVRIIPHAPLTDEDYGLNDNDGSKDRELQPWKPRSF